MRSVISQLSLHKLEVFCMVAELQSVSRAAERLGLAQPVVSAHVKSLSEKIGAALIQRSGRRIVLTDQGRRVHQWAQEVTVRTLELERELDESKSGLLGTVSIGASMTIGSFILPSMIFHFRRSHPNAQISVQVAPPSAILDSIHNGACDFAFTIIDPRRDLSGLQVETVRDERLVLVASNRSSITEDSVTPETLAELWFVTAQTDTPRWELEEETLRRHGISHRNIAMEFGHAEAAKQAVRAGAGVAFLCESSVRDELASGLLRQIETPGMELHVPFCLVSRHGKQLNQFQSNLMSYLATEMRAIPKSLV